MKSLARRIGPRFAWMHGNFRYWYLADVREYPMTYRCWEQERTDSENRRELLFYVSHTGADLGDIAVEHVIGDRRSQRQWTGRSAIRFAATVLQRDGARGNLSRTRQPDDIDFSLPAAADGLLPPPIPAVQGLPDWFKAMPHTAFNAIAQAEGQTMKRCPPVIDAMTCGFLIPLPATSRWRMASSAGTATRRLTASTISCARRSTFTIPVRSPARRSSTPIGSSSSSTISGPSRRRRLLALDHASGQPDRPAVHHAHRPRRLRPLSRQPN